MDTCRFPAGISFVFSFLLLINVFYHPYCIGDYVAITADGSTCVKPISSQSFQAIYSFYNSTRGSSWTWLNESQSVGYKWNFSNVANVDDGAARPCRDDWQGVYCNDDPQNSELCIVAALELENYNLYGSLPYDIANISGLEELDLMENSLTGQLPSSLGLLSNLTYLYLDSNQLTGCVPSEIGSTNLVEFELTYNQMTGTIPDEFYNLQNLLSLSLGFNSFTGTLSSSINRFGQLEKLFLSENMFSGSLPVQLGNMTNTEFIELNNNRFTGSLSSELGLLNSLRRFYVDANYLTRTIPSEIGRMSALEYLDFDVNRLTGLLPTEIGDMTALITFGVALNKFSGPIPTALGSLRTLKNMNLAQNSLTGTVPTEFGNLDKLVTCYLDNNLLTGTVPSFVNTMQSLHEFILEGNLLTSTIPTQVADLTNLYGFSVAVNYLSGTVVDSFTSNLLLLQFDVNFFTGSLTELFPSNAAQKFPELLSFTFTENGFTGSFPSSLLGLPKIHTIFGDSNCFGGQLLCPTADSDNAVDGVGMDISLPFHLNNSGLTILDLNGLSSGMGCRNYIVDRSVLPNSGYYSTTAITGSIPSCLWHLPSLTALYLVGNGFTGPVYSGSDEQSVRISSLKNLSLASNELTGTIPDFILQHNFTQLDLSSNRLVGHVQDTFFSVCSTSVQLDLSVNRLSGNLDIAEGCDFNSLASNVLGGNLFTFDMYVFPPDVQEEALSYYGSYTLNIAMIVASPILVVLLMAGICLLGCRIVGTSPEMLIKFEWVKRLALWHEHWQLVMLPVDVMYYFNTSINYGRVLIVFMSCVVLTMLFLYCLLKTLSSENEYATYVNQYSWVASAAYLHGSVPVIAIASILFGSLLLIGVAVAHALHPRRRKNFGVNGNSSLATTRMQAVDSASFDHKFRADNTSKVMTSEGNWNVFVVGLKLFAVLVVNTGIIGLANWGYLIAVLNNNPHIQFIQIALSIFKLLWNATFIGFSLRWIRDPTSQRPQCNPLLLRYFIKLINFVLIPCLATALVDGNCFLKLFEQSPAPIVYSDRCDGLPDVSNGTVTCDGNIVNSFMEQSFTPPFIYSFQCSSAVITNYVPVLLYSFAISGLVVPVILIGYMLLTQARADGTTEIPGKEHSEGCFDAVFFGLFESWIPHVLRPITVVPRPSIPRKSGNNNNIQDGITKARVLFPLESLASTQLLNATLCFTFGLVFPYLGVVIIGATVFELWVWLIAIGKFHHCEVRQSSMHSSSPSDAQSQYQRGSMASLLLYRNSLQQGSPSKVQPFLMKEKESARQNNHDDGVSSVDVLVTLTAQSVQHLRLMDLVFVIVVVCAFWSALFFDMIADVHGTHQGLIVMLCVMLAAPTFSIGVVASYYYGYEFCCHDTKPSVTENNVIPNDSFPKALNSSDTAGGSISLKFTAQGMGGEVDERYSINSNNPVISALHNSDFSRASENGSNM